MRHYLSSLLDRINLGEWFNTNTSHVAVNIDGEHVQVRLGEEFTSDKETTEYISASLPGQIKILDRLSDINRLSVFGIHAGGYNRLYPEGLKIVQRQRNIQFIQLERADVLYSLFSRSIAMRTDVWHNGNLQLVSRDIKRFVYPMAELKETLLRYVIVRKYVLDCFGLLPTVYYEQFQFNTGNIRNMFDGIPNKLISIPINKFVGNHKDLIVNLDEVETYYEEFVNTNREFFPQYFGNVPGIIIPASQGYQPHLLEGCH